jgi:hypothetical protein
LGIGRSTQERYYLDEQVVSNGTYCYRVSVYGVDGGIERTRPACSPLPRQIDSSSSKHVTVLATNAAELRSAATLPNNVTILIDREIELYDGIAFSSRGYSLELRGTTPSAGIRFTKRFDGNWSDAHLKGENGLEFLNRHSVIRDLTIRGYEFKGSAIRSNVTDLLHVQNCVLEDISTQSWPTRTRQPANDSSEVWFGNGIGGGGQIIVEHTVFRRVATSDAYAHCIYPTDPTRSLTVTNCTFEYSGQPVVTTVSSAVWLFANTYHDLVKVPDARRLDDHGIGIPVWAYWVAFASDSGPSNNLFAAMEEKFVNATFRWPIRNRPDPARHYFNFNDYSGLRIESDAGGVGQWLPWSSVTSPGMDWPAWQRSGYDQNSRPPSGH